MPASVMAQITSPETWGVKHSTSLADASHSASQTATLSRRAGEIVRAEAQNLLGRRLAQRFEGGELLDVGLSRGPERVSVLVWVDAV